MEILTWLDSHAWTLVIITLVIMAATALDSAFYRKLKELAILHDPKLEGVLVSSVEMTAEEREFHAIAKGMVASQTPVTRVKPENWMNINAFEMGVDLLTQALGNQKWDRPKRIDMDDNEGSVRIYAKSRAGMMLVDLHYLPSGKVCIEVKRVNGQWLFRYVRYAVGG